MTVSRRRRIVRRALLVCTGTMVLFSWYVCAWIAMGKAEGRQLLRQRTLDSARSCFLPLIEYCESDLPGSALLSRVYWLGTAERKPNGGRHFYGGCLAPESRTLNHLFPPRSTAPNADHRADAS